MTYESVGRRYGFKVRIQEIFWKQSSGNHTIKIAAQSPIYTSGQNDATVYLIESGKVRLVLPTPEGTSCLLAIRSTGDIFGELCLSGDTVRQETAIAMQDTTLRQMSRSSFLTGLKQKPSLHPLVLHLASFVDEQLLLVAALTSETDEQRVAEFLLRLGWDSGGGVSSSISREGRLSEEDLAEMVGTTRSRIGAFFRKFRELGLINLNSRGCLVVREDSLSDYIARTTFGERVETDRRGTQTSGITERIGLPLARSRAPAAACSL